MTDKKALASHIVELENPELPLCCPNRQTPVTSLHPRVYLEIEADNTSFCPYCSTLYLVRSLTA